MFNFKAREGENLVQIFRQTSVFLSQYIIIALAALIIPWAFLAKYELDAKFRRILLLWAILIIILVFRKCILWLLNCYVITDKRVIRFNYIGIFHRQILEANLDKIINVNLESKGVQAWIFSYGNVNLQLIGINEPLVLRRVKKPQEVKDLIGKLIPRPI